MAYSILSFTCFYFAQVVSICFMGQVLANRSKLIKDDVL